MILTGSKYRFPIISDLTKALDFVCLMYIFYQSSALAGRFIARAEILTMESRGKRFLISIYHLHRSITAAH